RWSVPGATFIDHKARIGVDGDLQPVDLSRSITGENGMRLRGPNSEAVRSIGWPWIRQQRLSGLALALFPKLAAFDEHGGHDLRLGDPAIFACIGGKIGRCLGREHRCARENASAEYPRRTRQHRT